MHILGYVILIFGLVGILLGLYGLLMPVAKRRGLTFSLPRLRLPSASPPDEYGDQLEDVLEELEGSSFRSSPFEAPAPAPRVAPEPPPKVIQVTSYVRPPEIEAPVASMPVLLAVPEAGLEEELDEEEEEPLTDELLELDEPESSEVEAEPEAAVEEEHNAEAAADGPNSDMMALFDQVAEESAIPEALRDAVPVVSMEELLADARAIREMIAGGGSSANHAA